MAAYSSLIEEVELTPKPGLVDSRNTGAHQDLSLQLMHKSAVSLIATFEEIAQVSYGEIPSQYIREKIAAIGRTGEKRMFEATGGVNTHKGAIWAIGLLISAASMGKGTYETRKITSVAGEIARFSDRFSNPEQTNGRRVTERYGVKGAKGEAMEGFPHVVQNSMPRLIECRKIGMSEKSAQLHALLSLMAHLDDTCILHRGGLKALTFVKFQASSILQSGNLDLLIPLDDKLISCNISPGGSADLLAATLFLDKIQPSTLKNKKSNQYVHTIT